MCRTRNCVVFSEIEESSGQRSYGKLTYVIIAHVQEVTPPHGLQEKSFQVVFYCFQVTSRHPVP